MEYSCRAAIRANIQSGVLSYGPLSDPVEFITDATGKIMNSNIHNISFSAFFYSFNVLSLFHRFFFNNRKKSLAITRVQTLTVKHFFNSVRIVKKKTACERGNTSNSHIII